MQPKKFLTVATLILISFPDTVGAADEWVLVRNQYGFCSVQPSTAQPLLGTEIGRASTKAEACRMLLDRYESATEDPGKCGNYTTNLRALCKAANVELPDPNH